MAEDLDTLPKSGLAFTASGTHPLGSASPVLEQALDASPDGFLVFDRDLRYLYWNAAMERLFGCPRDAVVGRTALELFPHLAETGEESLMREAASGRTAVSGERPCVLGFPPREGFYEAYYSPLRDAQGTVAGGIGIIRDVTERKRAVDEQAEIEERFRTMADCAPVLLWMAGNDSECYFFNETWLLFTGRSLEAERGVGWAEGVHHEDLHQVLETYMTSFYARREFEMEYRLRRADGEYRWVLDHGAPRYTPDGRFAGYIGSCIDITDRRKAEEDLKTVAGRLLRSNEELQRFAYIASHDLQEPLRTIIGYTQLLARRFPEIHDAEADELIALTVQEGQRMKLLIEDLLRYSRLGGEERRRRIVDCGAVALEVLASLRSAIDESGAEVTVEPLPAVMGDPSQITHLFQNLLSNSIKFRGDRVPRIDIAASRGTDECTFTFRDNGIGFDMRYLDRIFVIFQRLHHKDEFPGTGMGLAICKKIVELHGGRIWAESVPGDGATFFFTLPAAPPGQGEP